MVILYSAILSELLYNIFEGHARFFLSLLKRSQINGILGEGELNCLLNKLRHGILSLGCFYPQCVV